MSDNNTEVKEVEIIETTPVVEDKIDIAELSPEEQSMAEENGVVPKNVVVENKESIEKVDNKKKSFEDMEKNENTIGEYTKNEQALYFKWKSDKKARQEAQAERDLKIVQEKVLRTELDKAREEGNLTVGKLNAINKLLNGDPEDITIEAIQEILAANVKKAVEEEKPLTKSDLLAIEAEKAEKEKAVAESNKNFVTRMNTLEEYGKTKFEDYDEVIASAKEVLDGKAELPEVIDRADIARRLVEKINDPKNDEDDISDFVLGIAKLNPNYGKKKVESGKSEGSKKVSSEDIDKIVKNAAKGASSATVNGGNARRVVSHDNLTIEDAAKLTPEQYMKLPKEVRTRLLQS